MTTMNTRYTKQFLAEIRQARTVGFTQQQIAKKFNLTMNQVKYVYHLLHKDKLEQLNSLPESQFDAIGVDDVQNTGLVTKSDDGSILAKKILAVDNVANLSDADVLRLFGFDPKKFKLVSFAYGYYGRERGGRVLTTAKIKIRPVTDTVSIDDMLDVINHDVKPIKLFKPKRQTNNKNNIENIIIPLFDLHFGIIDIQVAYMYLLNLQQMLHNKHYNKALIVLGGDVFHSNFMNKTQTVKNTQLDHVDNMKALTEATEFFDDLIRNIYLHADTVDVIHIGGNHDFDKSFLWSYAMSIKWQRYANFHLTTNTRTYFMLDHVMIAVSHGDIATNNMANLMSVEQPKMWAQATDRLSLSGHYHKNVIRKIAENDDGVTTYQCSTIKPEDRYEKDHGFTMSGHRLEVFTTNSYHIISVQYLYNTHVKDNEPKLKLSDAI